MVLTVSDGYLLFVEYYVGVSKISRGGYKMPIADITSPVKQHTSWTKLVPTSHADVVLVSNSSSPVVIGGHWWSQGTTSNRLKKYDATANIEMYDDSSRSWNKIDSLSFARTGAAVAAIGNNAIVVIGGCADAC